MYLCLKTSFVLRGFANGHEMTSESSRQTSQRAAHRPSGLQRIIKDVCSRLRSWQSSSKPVHVCNVFWIRTECTRNNQKKTELVKVLKAQTGRFILSHFSALLYVYGIAAGLSLQQLWWSLLHTHVYSQHFYSILDDLTIWYRYWNSSLRISRSCPTKDSIKLSYTTLYYSRT